MVEGRTIREGLIGAGLSVMAVGTFAGTVGVIKTGVESHRLRTMDQGIEKRADAKFGEEDKKQRTIYIALERQKPDYQRQVSAENNAISGTSKVSVIAALGVGAFAVGIPLRSRE